MVTTEGIALRYDGSTRRVGDSIRTVPPTGEPAPAPQAEAWREMHLLHAGTLATTTSENMYVGSLTNDYIRGYENGFARGYEQGRNA